MHPHPATFVHLHIDDFLVSAERHHDAALAGRPLVIGGERGAPGRVVAASAEARARGVMPGMRLREAARRCRRAVFLAGDLERQHDVRALTEEIVRARWPRIAWTAIDEAVVDLSSSGPASARRAAEDLQGRLHEALGLAVSFGIASGPLAAGVAARLARPRGLVVVLPGYDARFLASLPIQEFEPLDDRSRHQLLAAGVTTVGALAALPVDRAVALLGRGGGALVRMAAGRGEAPPSATSVPRRVCRQRVFEAPTGSVEHEIAPLVADVSSTVRRLGLGTSTLGLRVENADGVSRTYAVPLPRPASDEATLARTAARLLARALAPGRHVRLVSLTASGLVPVSPQGELFDRRPASGPRRHDPLPDHRGWDRRAWPRLAG